MIDPVLRGNPVLRGQVKSAFEKELPGMVVRREHLTCPQKFPKSSQELDPPGQ